VANPPNPPAGPAQKYDAFVSYSHAADAQFAPFLQGALQRFARPIYRLRSVRVFRDATGLTLTPDLWPDIVKGIDGSRHFILLASPDAAASPWVHKEIDHWLTLGRGAPLLVVTDGTVAWDTARNDFDWTHTTALPPNLGSVYPNEPLYLDATGLKAEELSNRHPKVRSAAAQLYARLTGRALDDVIGEDIQTYRRNMTLAAAALSIVAVLVTLFVLQRVETRRQQTIAEARRQLDLAKDLARRSLIDGGGPEAVHVPTRDAQRSAMLAAESVHLVPTVEGVDALRAHLALAPPVSRALALAADATPVAVSRNGRFVALRSTVGTAGMKGISVLSTDAPDSPGPVARVPEADRVFVTDDGVVHTAPDGAAALAYQIAPDGLHAAAFLRTADGPASVVLWRIGDATPVWQQAIAGTVRPVLAFSNNSAWLAYLDRQKVSVRSLADGTISDSHPTELNDVSLLAVDNSGKAVLVFGWEHDPALAVGKSHVLRALPVGVGSLHAPFYYRARPDLGTRAVAIDIAARVVAFGGDTSPWIKVVDYGSTDTIAVIRDDDLLHWTLDSSSSGPAIVTVDSRALRRRGIERSSPEAARAALAIDADTDTEAAAPPQGGSVAVSTYWPEKDGYDLQVLALPASGAPRVLLTRRVEQSIERLVASPSATSVAIWLLDGRVQVLAVPSGEVIHEILPARRKDERAEAIHLSYSTDGAHFITGRESEGVVVVDVATRARRLVAGPVPDIAAVAVALKGTAAAWGSIPRDPALRDCSCVAFSLQLAPDRTPLDLGVVASRSPVDEPAASLAFDETGTRLVAGVSHGVLRVWTAGEREPDLSLLYDGWLRDLSFGGSGRYLLTSGSRGLNTGGTEAEVAVWSLQDGRRIWRRLTSRTVHGFFMSPSAESVGVVQASGGGTRGLGIAVEHLFWRPADLVRLACERFDYRLTADEREAFLLDRSGSACP
jgi:WD40 repeat protein